MRHIGWTEGSFTIEAAFLTTIILTILTAYMLFGMYMHDRIVLYSAAAYMTEVLHYEYGIYMIHESADELAEGNILIGEEETEGYLRRVENSLLITEINAVSVESRGGYVICSCSPRIPEKSFFGLIFNSIGNYNFEVKTEMSMDPVLFLRIVRSIKGG